MAKWDNLLSMLWMLRDGRKLTAAQIADSLEISVRTVYRYIGALCASGVPVVAESGHDGGIRVLESFKETPLFFHSIELKALARFRTRIFFRSCRAGRRRRRAERWTRCSFDSAALPNSSAIRCGARPIRTRR